MSHSLPGPTQIHCHVWTGSTRGAIRGPALIAHLIEHYGITDKEVVRSSRGKPLIKDSDLYLSVTHSDRVGMAMITNGTAVGCDLERHKNRDINRIVTAYFSEDEKRQLSDSKRPNNRFYELWTLKESYSKALDLPLRTSLRKDFSDVKLQDWADHINLAAIDAEMGVATLMLPEMPLPSDSPAFALSIALATSEPGFGLNFFTHKA